MRTNIIAEFDNVLQQTSQASIHRGFLTLQQVNDFPTICYIASTQRYDHSESRNIYRELQINIRGYVRGENSNDRAEELADEIEIQTNTLNEGCPSNITECRVDSIRTDEGLFEPYGILDMDVTIKWLPT